MKRVPIVILFTALLTAAILFIGTCNSNPQKDKPDKTELIKSQQKAQSIDNNFKTEFEFLQIKSDSLQKELSLTQSKLKATKFKLNQSQLSLLALAQKQNDTVSVAQQLIDCDSLKTQTLSYVAWVDSVQCQYENNILQLNDLVAIKDSQVVVCKASFLQLKNVLDENFIREQKLTDDLNTAYKSLRKKVIQNKLLAGGMLVLSGIATTLYINANK
ncbi:MAG: hypothetical protein Q8T03_13330 [Bacteroidota bacterium]|nr:hypothetical protein [Bacteroidota bacterium]MDP3558348.1 hypothetical protein [Bacteroidota bacterium]